MKALKRFKETLRVFLISVFEMIKLKCVKMSTLKRMNKIIVYMKIKLINLNKK